MSPRAIVLIVLFTLAVWIPLPREQADIAVGSKAFTESVTLGEMIRHAARSTGVTVRHFQELGGTPVVFEALRNGEIDAYPEYTGTLRRELFANLDLETDRALRSHLKSLGIEMTEPIGFENSYDIAVRRETAERLGLRTIDDLSGRDDLRYGVTSEFLNRKDGWIGLREAYNLTPRSVNGMEHSLAYQQIRAGDVDVIDVYTTDADLARGDLVILEDSREFFPVYDAVILYRSDLEDRYPAVRDVLGRLGGTVTESEMTDLNAAVKIGGESSSQMAAEFLTNKLGLKTATVRVTPAERITRRTREHFELVRRSLFWAVLIAVPLGILAARTPWLGATVLGVVGVVQTIPALALLVLLLVPAHYFGWETVGEGSVVALVALFLYSLLPIVRNTVTGLGTIDRSLTESAEVLGLTRTRKLLLIDLPLAAPMILAGVKTAAILNIGFATLGALIGAGGYGQPILTGVRLNDLSRVLEGAIPAAIMAIVAQGLFALIERIALPKPLRSNA